MTEKEAAMGWAIVNDLAGILSWHCEQTDCGDCPFDLEDAYCPWNRFQDYSENAWIKLSKYRLGVE